MLRKILISLAGLALAVGFLACQSDVTEPTPVELLEEYDSTDPEEWEYPAIYGRCWDEEEPSQPIYMAKVTWRCGEEVLGYCISRMDGWYRISDLTTAWEVYNGLYLDGEATHSLYSTTTKEIIEYEYPNNYNRVFYMDPDPGHGELTTNGLIEGRVKRDDTGEYIYPACVTVYGEDDVFLGYDTT